VKPVVAVTFGDASGIGPELVAKLLLRPDARAAAQIVVVGDAWVLAEGEKIAGTTSPIKVIHGGMKRAMAMARRCFWTWRRWRMARSRPARSPPRPAEAPGWR
jgi:4-hydroxy-L-threonine phosphate dehydrogenase PdxA